MRIALFGASGFVGRSILRHILDRGWSAMALARHAGVLASHPRLETVNVDLAQAEAVVDLAGVDAVVWAVASAGDVGSDLARFGRAIDAMAKACVGRLIVAGSISVLNYTDASEGTVLDESSPTETDFDSRDAYARVKWGEERLARSWASERRGDLTILRLGAVIGPGRVWTARLGFQLRRNAWLEIMGDGQLPVVHVDDIGAATANILAEPQPPPLLHLVHGRPPSRGQYIELMCHCGLLARPLCRLSGRALRSIFASAGPWSPISRRRFDARFRAVCFSGNLAGRYMPGSARQPIAQLIERCQAQHEIAAWGGG